MGRSTWLIILREFRSRVFKRSFIWMSIIGPLVMAGVIVFAFWSSLEESEEQKVLVVDDSYPFFAELSDTKKVTFDVQDISLAKAEALIESTDHTAILYLPDRILANKSAQFIFKKKPSFRVRRQIEERLQEYLEISKLSEFNISETDYRRMQAPVSLITLQYNGPDQAAEEVDQLPAIVGFTFALLIFMFIFIYSVGVMRGVMEEKTNRIIEVMVSSVRPIQLMIGKIIGVGAVGLTQFLIWVILTFTLVGFGQRLVIGDRYLAGTQDEGVMTEMVQQGLQQQEALEMLQLSEEDSPFRAIQRINFPLMIGMFLFYFLGGYLLYSALMAAIGSAADTDTDTRQFVLPVTAPLFLAYFLAFRMAENPDSALSVWMSIIPFTSPVAMMIRVTHGIDTGDIWQLYLSMALLVATFIGAVWVSAKVYRVGILMYGKKVTFRELFKWLTYK